MVRLVRTACTSALLPALNVPAAYVLLIPVAPHGTLDAHFMHISSVACTHSMCLGQARLRCSSCTCVLLPALT
eukprot:1162112-Pelagomonas_calceolata.AAC.6